MVEIFNVCWPMYAAMPAIPKEAMWKRHMYQIGWDLASSGELAMGAKYPNFADLLEQIEALSVEESKYSADSKV
ncbi:MAG: hypothetical protein ACLTW9_07810 [Enterocloster sp.]